MLVLRWRWRCSLSLSGRDERNHGQHGCRQPPIRFRAMRHERTRMLDAQFPSQESGQSCGPELHPTIWAKWAHCAGVLEGTHLEFKGSTLKLIVQPADGLAPLLKAIKRAKKRIEIVIFRFDQTELEHALEDAAQRGVFVHALIAFTNRGGEKNLRKLEMRFLEKGITVARTADDLVRYHGKMMLVDGKELFLLTYNFTHLDTERSRSFGIVTRNRHLVKEAARLFQCDTKRQPYKRRSNKFVVSPANARPVLEAFIKGAKRDLLIYDVDIGDKAMMRVLEERAQAGVRVNIIGHVGRSKHLSARVFRRMRLHTRVVIRDCKHALL